MSDTPSTFTANKNVVVNSAGNALEFVDEGTSSNEIIPVAFAFLTADTAGTGTGISWGAYNSNNKEIDFTFATTQPDANYFVLWSREQYAQHEITVTDKTTTGFKTTWTNNDGSALAPSLFGGGLVVYSSTPTKSVGAGWNEALPTATANDLGAIKIGSGLSIDGNGVVTASGGGGSASDSFKTISVSQQTDVVADSTTDTLTFAAGSNMTITTNAQTDTITFASSGGGGGGTTSIDITSCLFI